MSVEDFRGFLEDELPTIIGRLGPSEELGFVFQVSTAFTAIGLAIAFYRRRRNPDLDTFTITAAWTLLGTLAGVVAVVVVELVD
jgi:hypothetical protein